MRRAELSHDDQIRYDTISQQWQTIGRVMAIVLPIAAAYAVGGPIVRAGWGEVAAMAGVAGQIALIVWLPDWLGDLMARRYFENTLR
jgi:DUF1680 family protein